jgi:hypothetical protein
MQCKRRAKEKEAAALPRPAASEELWRQAQALVDDALSRLADRYRVPIVMCDLEGRTIKDAARELGWPQGTLATRLTRGRAQLARRLAAAGLPLSGATVTTLLAPSALAAQVPAPLLYATVRAAGLFALGNTTASGAASATALALTQGVLNAMLLSKLKIASAVVVVVAALGLGLGANLRAGAGDEGEPFAAAQQAPPEQPAEPATPGRNAGRPGKKGELRPEDRDLLLQRIEALERTVQRLTMELGQPRKPMMGMSGTVGMGTGRGLPAPDSPPSPKLEVKIFLLKHAEVSEVALTLQQLLGDEDRRGQFGGGNPDFAKRAPRIATHKSTNSLLVQGSADDLQTIQAILMQLDDERVQPPPPPPVKDAATKPRTTR